MGNSSTKFSKEYMTQKEADNYNNPNFFDYLIEQGSTPGFTLPPPISEEDLENGNDKYVPPVYDPSTFWTDYIPPEDRHSILKYSQFKRNVNLNHNFARGNMGLNKLKWDPKEQKLESNV